MKCIPVKYTVVSKHRTLKDQLFMCFFQAKELVKKIRGNIQDFFTIYDWDATTHEYMEILGR
ncbi:MAG: hypothetical protein WBA93_17305 [Microcoleaceae cyanobacterium]